MSTRQWFDYLNLNWSLNIIIYILYRQIFNDPSENVGITILYIDIRNK